MGALTAAGAKATVQGLSFSSFLGCGMGVEICGMERVGCWHGYDDRLEGQTI